MLAYGYAEPAQQPPPGYGAPPPAYEIFTFANGQTEVHWPTGDREIVYPDGTIKFVDSRSGQERSIFRDGRVLLEASSLPSSAGQNPSTAATGTAMHSPGGSSATLLVP